MNGEAANSEVFARALAAIENNGVDYYEPEVGDVFDIGSLEIAVLHPKSLVASTNNNSISLRLQYGEIAFIFTGDTEQQAESEMLSRGINLQAQILQVGHHGANTSSTEQFLQAVNPEVAIYSAGVENQYGHPNIETVTRIESSGALLYGTDVHGTIMVETDGKTYSVHTHKQGTIPRQTLSTSEKTDTQLKDTSPLPDKSCININSASEAEVQRIIHIGPSRSNDLINQRPFNSVDDLTKIKGIGPARIQDIIAQGFACTGG